MKASSTLSSKGQVTIPLEVRKRLGIREGDKVEFVNEKGRIYIRPARGNEDNPFARWQGVLPAFVSSEEINQWLKEMREE